MLNDATPADFQVQPDGAWYERLRQQWKPAKVRLLLVAESVPNPIATEAERRFFYAPTVSRADNLFRGVALGLYGEKLHTGQDRAPLLSRLQDDGVWLIDLAPFPVNHLSSGDRRRALKANAPSRVREILELNPDGIVICHTPSFKVLAPELTAAAAPLLHEQPIPFPLGNYREAFAAALRTAVSEFDFGSEVPRN